MINRVKNGAINGVAIVAGEAGSRLIRSRLLGMPAGTLLAGGVEFAAATALGIVAEKVAGPQIGGSVTSGGFAGVIRAAAKQFNIPFVAEALGDEGGTRRFIIRGGRVLPAPGKRLAGYVGNGQRLAGYVGNGQRLAGYTDEAEELFGV